jgi:hypothetical protein
MIKLTIYVHTSKGENVHSEKLNVHARQGQVRKQIYLLRKERFDQNICQKIDRKEQRRRERRLARIR